MHALRRPVGARSTWAMSWFVMALYCTRYCTWAQHPVNVLERGSHCVEGICAVGDAFIEEVVYDLVHHDCIHGLVFDLVHAADVALHEPHLVDARGRK